MNMSKTMLQSMVKGHGHSPTLNTILEIENTIRKKGYFNSKTELYRSLKNKTQYGTLNTVLKYLEASNKIEFNKDESLVWIFLDKKNKSLLKTLKKSVPLR
jgi:DNA-binding phage protein